MASPAWSSALLATARGWGLAMPLCLLKHMSVLAVPGSIDVTHTLPLYSVARAEEKVVTYDLEAEYLR